MLKLQDASLQQILPPSIAYDKTVQNIVQAINEKLLLIDRQTELILLLPRLDELPETLVDELAWQYHVDFYDYTADINKKRALVRNAIAWHRYKGTPAAVEEVCTAVFKSAKVYEWFQYGGEPYHFQVRLIEEGVPDEKVIDNLERAIKVTKNTRSWLDGLSFYRELLATIYLAKAMWVHKSVSIYPSKFKMPDVNVNVYIGNAIRQQRSVKLCQIGAD